LVTAHHDDEFEFYIIKYPANYELSYFIKKFTTDGMYSLLDPGQDGVRLALLDGRVLVVAGRLYHIAEELRGVAVALALDSGVQQTHQALDHLLAVQPLARGKCYESAIIRVAIARVGTDKTFWCAFTLYW
jgi:hypothetical protein